MSDDSSRDTTPAWPEPTAKVPAAQRDILALWENSRPDTPVNASVLVVALQKRGHSASAAHWAIHRMIGDGRLLAEGRHISPCSSGTTASGTPYFVVGTTIYPGGWSDYRNFQVLPTEKFWAWAQEPEAATPSPDIPAGEATAKGKRKASINARMIDTLQKQPEAKDWTIEQCMKHLGCKSKASVDKTKCWETIMGARAVRKVQRLQQDQKRTR